MKKQSPIKKWMSHLSFLGLFLLFPLQLMAASALQSYNIDENQISVSGLSSGGFMASQLHVAYSSTFMGVGIVAGGVYYCAEGSQMDATGRCMSSGSIPSGGYFANIADNLASSGKIDATSNMSGDKIWIFTGSNDTVVRTLSSDRARDFYEHYTASTNIAYSRNQVGAGHSMPTTDYGNNCSAEADPYINDCNYDAAGQILQHIYGSLNAPSGMISSNLTEFDQSEFTDSFYVGSEGYVYVPDACESGATCRLHVALHGCVQNKDDIGDQYARHTGYNEWAEANNIIVVYPQTSTSATNSCWDWWGFADLIGGGEYHTQSGVHMQFVKAVVDRLAGGHTGGGGGDDGGDDGGDGGGGDGHSCTETNASNYNHVQAGRAQVCNYWYACAVGSGDNLGLNNTYTYTTLAETSPDYYEQGSCP